MDRSIIKKYFKKFPKWTLLFILIGVLAFLEGVSGESGGVIALGLLLAAVGIAVLVLYFKGKPTDAQFDSVLNEDLKSVQREALSKLGIDESELLRIDPDIVVGYEFGRKDCFFGIKKGKDDVIRYTPQSVLVLNYTQNQVLTYRCVLDLDTGKFLSAQTEEFFYKDIVSVKTKSEDQELSFKVKGKMKKFKGNSEVFCLTNSGGESLTIPFASSAITDYLGEDGTLPSKEMAEKALSNIRRMLRDKKA